MLNQQEQSEDFDKVSSERLFQMHREAVRAFAVSILMWQGLKLNPWSFILNLNLPGSLC